MNMTAQNVEVKIQLIAASLASLRNEVTDIVKVYFATGANALVGALSTSGTAATVSSKLTKGEFTNGVTLALQLEAFFQNEALTQNDYMLMAQNLINGNDAAGGALSADVEALGARLVTMGVNVIEVFKQCKDVLKTYSVSELSAAVSAISSTTIVFGGNVTKTKMLAGITLVEQFKKVLNNEVASQSDYSTTVSDWVNA